MIYLWWKMSHSSHYEDKSKIKVFVLVITKQFLRIWNLFEGKRNRMENPNGGKWWKKRLRNYRQCRKKTKGGEVSAVLHQGKTHARDDEAVLETAMKGPGNDATIEGHRPTTGRDPDPGKDDVGHARTSAETRAHEKDDITENPTLEKEGIPGRGHETIQRTDRDTGHTEGHPPRPLDRRTSSAVLVSPPDLVLDHQLIWH